MQTVAEGVETLQQLEVLRGLGCDAAQGYYWSRPLPADQVDELLLGPQSQAARSAILRGSSVA
jgi:EAL domain-containing protein (putative c-di-GMP-specific phosphodiesterase class I)